MSSLAAAAKTGSTYPGHTSCDSSMSLSLHGELEGEVRTHGSPCRRSLRRSLRNASSSSLETSTWVFVKDVCWWQALMILAKPLIASGSAAFIRGWPMSSLAAAAKTGSTYPGHTSCDSSMSLSLHGELEGEVRTHGSPCRRSLRRSLRNASSSSLETSTWVFVKDVCWWQALMILAKPLIACLVFSGVACVFFDLVFFDLVFFLVFFDWVSSAQAGRDVG